MLTTIDIAERIKKGLAEELIEVGKLKTGLERSFWKNCDRKT